MSSFELQILAPSENLKHLVRRVLVTQGECKTPEILPVGPTGFCYLTYSGFPIQLHYQDRILASDKRLYFAGQLKDEQPYFRVHGKIMHIGLELYPQVAYYLFGIEGKDLLDNVLTFEKVSPLAQSYLDKLDEANSCSEIIETLEDVLRKTKHVHSNVAFIDEAVNIIIESKGQPEINKLVDKLKTSERNFRRVFSKIIGLTPKRYSKVIQFNAALEGIRSGDEKIIYDLALSCGYYDHAHFINDFRKFLGQSPRKFIDSGHHFLKDYLGTSTSEKIE